MQPLRQGLASLQAGEDMCRGCCVGAWADPLESWMGRDREDEES